MLLEVFGECFRHLQIFFTELQYKFIAMFSPGPPGGGGAVLGKSREKLQNDVCPLHNLDEILYQRITLELMIGIKSSDAPLMT